MLKFINNNKKILFPLLALFLAVFVLIGEVYAWFYVSNESSTQSFALGVVNLDDSSGSVEVAVVGGSGGESEILNPDGQLVVAFSVSNDETISNNYELYLQNYTQSYPTNNLDESLLDYDVYSITNFVETKIDLDYEETQSAGFKQNFYDSFRSPITKALSYRLYLRDSQNLGDYSFLSSNIAEGNVINDRLTTFSVSANSVSELCFEVWFNPVYYPTCTINGVDYIIKNSNAFSGQSFQITLGVRKV